MNSTSVSLRVLEVDPQVDPRWEAFVAAHPDGLIYHHPAWLQTLWREYGSELVALACEDEDGRFHGVLPLFRTRGLPFGRGGDLLGSRLSSLPRTPVAGPLALDDQGTAALLRAAVERSREAPDTRLQIKVQAPKLDGLVDGMTGVPWRLSYALELPDRPEQIRFGSSRNHSTIKRLVNKAARSGVRVRPAETKAELRAWYRLYLDTMRWNFVPARSYRCFEAMWDLLRPNGWMRLLIAELHEAGRTRLIAGSVLLMYGQTVSYAFNGRDPNALSLRPNDAIHWNAIHTACAEGFQWYDFGEVSEDNSGLAQFKAKWGTEPRRLHRYYYPGSDTLGTEDHDSEGHVRRLAGGIWRRAPLGMTAMVSEWLYSYL